MVTLGKDQIEGADNRSIKERAIDDIKKSLESMHECYKGGLIDDASAASERAVANTAFALRIGLITEEEVKNLLGRDTKKEFFDRMV